MFDPLPQKYVIYVAKPESNWEEAKKQYPDIVYSSFYNKKGYSMSDIIVIATVSTKGGAEESFSYHNKVYASEITYDLHIRWDTRKKDKEERYCEEIYNIDTIGAKDLTGDMVLFWDMIYNASSVYATSNCLRQIWNKYVCSRILQEKILNKNKKEIKEYLMGYLDWVKGELI